MVDLRTGDCLEVLAELEACSVDALVTDPPYGLGKPPPIRDVLTCWLAGETYEAKGGGFMGKAWDAMVPPPEVWAAALRVVKPGAWGVVFAGTRTVDLMGISLRLGGWEVRDQIAYLYGSGFPKSLDVSAAIDRAAGAKREVIGRRKGAQAQSTGKYGAWGNDDGNGCSEFNLTAPATDAAKRWNGYGTALKPALEPALLVRRPLDGTYADNATRWGVGGLNIDAGRVNDRWPANVMLGHNEDCGEDCMPRCAVAMLDEQSGKTKSKQSMRGVGLTSSNVFGKGDPTFDTLRGHNDSGGASRFFYTAKPSRSEREAGLDGLPVWTGAEAVNRDPDSAGINNPRAGAGRTAGEVRNHHPTVKPVDLMRHLVQLVTPPTTDGRRPLILDPFMGSGTTGMAAAGLGLDFMGIDLDPAHVQIARARIEWAAPGRRVDCDQEDTREQPQQGRLF